MGACLPWDEARTRPLRHPISGLPRSGTSRWASRAGPTCQRNRPASFAADANYSRLGRLVQRHRNGNSLSSRFLLAHKTRTLPGRASIHVGCRLLDFMVDCGDCEILRPSICPRALTFETVLESKMHSGTFWRTKTCTRRSGSAVGSTRAKRIRFSD